MHANSLLFDGFFSLVNDEPSFHQVPAIKLLLEAVENGEAPRVSGLSEGDQRALDATARKLLKFLSKA